jgi:hypothetical protein
MKVFWSIAAVLSLWAAATVATSCYYDDYQTLYGTGGTCDTAAVSFAADIQRDAMEQLHPAAVCP